MLLKDSFEILQATINTSFCCFNVDLGELHRLNYVIISDSLYHDNTAMHLFQNVSSFSKVCAGHHKEDFSISAM